MLAKAVDLTGRRFGRLLINRRVPAAGWLAKCDCGAERRVKTSALLRGATKSCGCLYAERRINLEGTRFGRLVVIARAVEANMWRCQCDCGQVATAHSGNLRKSHTRSCGCLAREILAAHRASQIALAMSAADRMRAARESRARWVHANRARLKEIRRRWELAHPEYARRKWQRKVVLITDGYVRDLLRHSLPKEVINALPQPLIAAKRAHLKVQRLLREQA